jgi:Asp-tRNA(Asn)/Glu-tRNA(Gln) amidotransferase A subunit family amidase
MLRALDLAEAVENGDLTPSTVLGLALEAVQHYEAEIGAFAHLDVDAAELLAQRLGLGAAGLAGLPIGVKDIIDTADMPTSYGSPIYEGWQPKADATVVQMVRQAGGVILGKTVTTEFAHLTPARTLNPHNHAHTPGGSSSGSAAGVAAGMLALALGTQTGGSVIRPAAFCGVAAIKPSFRLLPTVGVKHFAWTLDTLGLFGARVIDVAYGLEAITGRQLRVDARDFGTPRIGVMRQPYAGTPAPEAEEALARAIKALEQAGATVRDLDEPTAFAEAHAAQPVIQHYEGALALAWEHRERRDALSPGLRRALDSGASHMPQTYDEARRKARLARHAAKDAFTPFDALLSFPAPGAAPTPETTGDSAYNKLTTMLGVPCVHVPVLKTGDNLPVGVQLLAAFGRDAEVLAVARFLEESLARS